MRTMFFGLVLLFVGSMHAVFTDKEIGAAAGCWLNAETIICNSQGVCRFGPDAPGFFGLEENYFFEQYNVYVVGNSSEEKAVDAMRRCSLNWQVVHQEMQKGRS